MAFTFNWAGARVRDIKPRDTVKDYTEYAGNFGDAARGAQNEILDYRYADLINGRNQRKAQVAELQKQIEGLENRNRELIGMAQDAQRRQGILAQKRASLEPQPVQEEPRVPFSAYPYRNWTEEMPPRENVVFNDGVPSTEILKSLFPRRVEPRF